jgi:hypothetical protein
VRSSCTCGRDEPQRLAGVGEVVDDQEARSAEVDGIEVRQEGDRHVEPLVDTGVVLDVDHATVLHAQRIRHRAGDQEATARQGDWVEIHYMNEGLQIHPMHLHGLPQLVVAKDGFPLEPYRVDTLNVAPGERYTVLVQASAPGVWAWHCHVLTHAEGADGMFGMVTTFVVQ